MQPAEVRVCQGVFIEAHTASATTPGGFHHEALSPVEAFVQWLQLSEHHSLADDTRPLQLCQHLTCMTAVRQVADGGNGLNTRQQALSNATAQEEGTNGEIPTPHIDTLGRQGSQLLARDKTAEGSLRQSAETTFGLVGMLDKHHIVGLGPQCREVAQVCAQLTTRMRRSEIGQVSGQRQVVFGVKYANFHLSGHKVTKNFHFAAIKFCNIEKLSYFCTLY